MKKISIIFLAALAMISCGNSYKPQDAELFNQTDSVNFAIGLANGLQIKMYHLQNDSSDEAIAEFIDALEEAYLGKEEELSEIAQSGRQFGTSIKMFEKNGLAENPSWKINEKIFFQALVNALHGDTLGMQAIEAEEFIRKHFGTTYSGDDAKMVKAKCPKSVKAVELKSFNDSINYAFGIANGTQAKIFLLSIAEAKTTAYGFTDNYDGTDAREG